MSAERDYVLDALGRYWPEGREAIAALPTAVAGFPDTQMLPPQVEPVSLPPWAADAGVDGRLLVPGFAVCGGGSPAWQRTDWLAAAFWYLAGCAERAFEAGHGPIHSYSPALKGWDSRLWDHAWVNRIALFLRRWAAHRAGQDEESLCGPLPQPEIELTHDVDAVAKTPAIRSKQAAFLAFNGAHALARGRLRHASGNAVRAVRFLLQPDDYWCFDRIAALEERYGVRSTFNFYAGRSARWRRPHRLLLDPAYDVRGPRLRQVARRLRAGGWGIGLHQAFDSWRHPGAMREERSRLEDAVGAEVRTCRQHWLRFSWRETWAAQEAAGLVRDRTLGFNDRPGFRNGAALCHRPWQGGTSRPVAVQSVPLVLMDSHLYDYGDMGPQAQAAAIARWIGEVRAVRGQASVVWHQRVFSRDYGWEPGYVSLLEAAADVATEPC